MSLVKVVAKLYRNVAGIQERLRNDNQKFHLSGNSIIVELKLVETKDNCFFYKIPKLIKNISAFYMNAMETGCNGYATMVSHSRGYKLQPYYVNGGAAFFRMQDEFVVTEVADGVLSMWKFSLEILKRDNRIKVTRELVITLKCEEQLKPSIAKLVYSDMVRSALKRSLMTEEPDSPVYADTFSFDGKF